MGQFSTEHAQQLLHNKFVVILGDSIQRSVYKDLVKFLQEGNCLTELQLRCKGEKTFLKDTLVEGGVLEEMHNGETYREVRQYCSDHHLVRFYFLTRVYSDYMESILSDFKSDHQPDVLIINSCIWDVNRYNDIELTQYRSNLETLFSRLREVLSPDCLILWNTSMPVGFRDTEMPELVKHNLRWDVIDGNFYSSTIAHLYDIDVLDMHYHFRLELPNRCKDAVHWNQLAHRKCTHILLSHIAKAWGVQLPQVPQEKLPLIGSYCPGYTSFDEPSPHIRGEFSFLPGQPLMVVNGMPGFAPFHGNYPKAPAPPRGPYPFHGMNIMMNFAPHPPFPPMNFGYFPDHKKLNDHNSLPMRRPIKQRDGQIHPYHILAPLLSRIY
ncbi:PC-esterase domain-containing protein 1A isoform X2 [Xenopus laevis]|uniref:PC-esterase domain-containing protein 1A isoform X2 n=1 Tax=Xenopus laevis TaxID=8355 RepID=A0A8J0U6Q9_XENLA|nr:PC-esterase domain-containing protein 1A isoform X2 [Xenopus laevis]